MKKYLIALSLLPGVLLAASHVMTVSAKQQDFTIKMRANPTTGYRWFLQSYDKSLLKAVSYQYVASKNPKLIGAPGTAVFTFAPTQEAFAVPQSTTITFEYARSWMPKSGTARSYTIRFAQ